MWGDGDGRGSLVDRRKEGVAGFLGLALARNLKRNGRDGLGLLGQDEGSI